MSKASNIFLYYCALIALFISVSGFLASKTVEGYAFQLVFLPITLYFTFAVVKNLAAWVRKTEKGPALDVTLSGKKTVLIVFFVLFLTLLAIAVKNIFLTNGTEIGQNAPPIANQNTESSDKDNALVFKSETTNQLLTVTADSPASLVNIRRAPSTSSAVIGRAKVGQEFSYVQASGEWYEIVLEGGQKGYVHKDYVTIKEP